MIVLSVLMVLLCFIDTFLLFPLPSLSLSLSLSLVGEDADAFALEQVDGKCFVLLSHGGTHVEFAMTMKHELEQHRLWCFCSHGVSLSFCEPSNNAHSNTPIFDLVQDEHMDRDKKERFHKAMQSCMVYCPILSERSMQSTELLAQIALADQMGKPTFPIVLSSITVPKAIRTPITLLRRQAFVFHCHQGDESGAINFRINFDHLARVVRARVSEASVLVASNIDANSSSVLLARAKQLEILDTENDVGQKEVPETASTAAGGDGTEKEDLIFVAGSPVKAAKAAIAARSSRSAAAALSPSKKKVSRYEQLHQRVQHQQQALVEAQETVEILKKEHEEMTLKLKNSKNITGELLMCVDYYRTKSDKYHEMLYPTPTAPGTKRSKGQVRLNQLNRELARVTHMPKKNRTVRQSLCSIHQYMTLYIRIWQGSDAFFFLPSFETFD